MKAFIQSGPARVYAFVLGLVLFGGGLSTRVAPEASLRVLTLSLFLSITVALIGVGWCLDDEPEAASFAIVVLPFKLLFIVPVTLFVARYERDAGSLLLIAGLPLLAFGLRPARAAKAHQAKEAGSPARGGHGPLLSH